MLRLTKNLLTSMNTKFICIIIRQDVRVLRQRTGAGFTLVEIMIVVAVIALLAVIALPNFIKSRSSAQVKACMRNLRVMDGAKAQWALDERKASTAIPLLTEIAPYLQDGRIPECPANGTYRLRRLVRYPACTLSAQGHTLANVNGDDDPYAD